MKDGPIFLKAAALAIENRDLRHRLKRVEKAALEVSAAASLADRALYLANERIKWLQSEKARADSHAIDMEVLAGWLAEEDV